MSIFDIFHKDKRQFGKGFICRVFVALFLAVSVSTFAIFTLLDTHATDEQIPSVYLRSNATSYDDKEPGAWKVTKTAGWTGLGKARIVFNVDTLGKLPDKDTDVLLVVNRGSGEENDRFGAVQSALKSLVNKFLDDGTNTISLVTFGHSYDIRTRFTDNRELLLSEIDDIADTSNCNIYQGLNGAERVLHDYTHDENRNTIVILLTNTEPNEEILYQSAEYNLIKLAYPYVTINAIQYRVADEIIGSLLTVSDNQYVADENNVEEMIFEASVVPYDFERFVLTDYINDDYFSVNGFSSIDASLGNYALSYDNGTPVVTWDLSEVLRSGSDAEMSINIELKSEYVTTPGTYRTNKYTTVSSALPETADENVTIDTSPILKTNYKITYSANAPSDCTVSGVPEEEMHFIYETIPFVSVVPTCGDYIFKGWKMTEEHIAFINDDYFIMPASDLTIAATWSKPTISKSMDGSVHVVQTLYDAIANKSRKENNEYRLDNTLDFSRAPNESNGLGVNTVYSTRNDEYPVHYFRGDVTDNNVLFAGVCWKAVRTTGTGGVKLIYNGEADSNNQCGTERSNHAGYGSEKSRKITGNYYYGTDFIYDESNNRFELTGIKTMAKWGEDPDSEMIGKYTCESSDIDATCTTMYFIESASSDVEYANVLPMQADIPYYSIAKTQFNMNSFPLSSMGYMRGSDIEGHSHNLQTLSRRDSARIMPSTSLNTSFWFGDDIYYNTETRKYELVNPFQISSNTEYADVIGKYTFRNSSEDYNNNVVYYIVSADRWTMYYMQLQNGETVEGKEKKYIFGNSLVDHGDGTYEVQDTFEIKDSEWGTRYNEATGKFVCGVGTTLCSNPRYVTAGYAYYYEYISASEKILVAKSHDGYNLQDYIAVYVYELLINSSQYLEYKYSCGNLMSTCTEQNFIYITGYQSGAYSYHRNVILGASVSWDGNQYTLEDTISIENIVSGLSQHHFACTTLGETTCDTVRFYYYGRSLSSGYEGVYIDLPKGVTTPEGLLEKLFENNKNSNAKSVIDAWYKRTIIGHAGMIEDTVYCNDRGISNWAGWSTMASSMDRYLTFAAGSRAFHPTLNCANPLDAFTVSPENGNGDLTYPVALISEDELIYAGNGRSYYFNNSHTYLTSAASSWTMTPYNYTSNNGYVYYWSSQSDYTGLLANNFQVRPVISIKPGVYIADGYGTEDSPWTLIEY